MIINMSSFIYSDGVYFPKKLTLHALTPSPMLFIIGKLNQTISLQIICMYNIQPLRHT